MQILKNRLLWCILFISLCGLFSIYTISYILFIKQIVKFGIGVTLAVLIARISINIPSLCLPFYIISILSLVVNLVFLSNDIRRWIHIGGIAIQSSEIAKVAILLMISKMFAEELTFYKFVQTVILIFIPIVLIFLQPNLGSALIIGLIGGIAVFIKGINLIAQILIILSMGIVAPFIWQHLLPYQKARIFSFLHPLQDPRGSSYQSIQSMIAVGAGGVFGSYQAQNKLGFIPENHTDFLFCNFAEKAGFIGSVFLISCIFIGIAYLIQLAQNERNEFKKTFYLLFAISWFVESSLNIGMNIGLLPITGNALPCFSYGGNSLIAFFVCIGLVFNMIKQDKSVYFS